MAAVALVERSLPQLTAKQREVLALVADNRTSKEIAGLLGISESAVNQRIEVVRARLGGLPRGELARLYRLSLSAETASDTPTWQNSPLSEHKHDSDQALPGSDRTSSSVEPHGSGAEPVDKVQLSSPFPAETPIWLSSNHRAMVLARLLVIAAIVAAGLAVAIVITSLIGPGEIAGTR